MLLETEDEETALKYYQDFKDEVIARFNIDSSWSLSSYDVGSWLLDKQREAELRKPVDPYAQGEVNPCDCYMRGDELNAIALGDKKLQVVDMDNLRSNMHLMRGHEFVKWFQEQFGHVPKRKE